MSRKTIIMITIVCVLLVCVAVIVMAGQPKQTSSISSESSNSQVISVNPIDPITPISNEPVLGTVHQIEVEWSDYDFIKDGTTEYKIVLPSDYMQYEQLAANELQSFIEQSSKIFIDIIYDDGLVLTEESKYISVGRTNLLEQTTLEVNKVELTDSGYKIVTINRSIFIIGGGHQGTLYGVYEFLKHTIGFHVYAFDEIVFDNDVFNLKLPIFNVKDIPDIAWRVRNYGVFETNVMFSHRMRLNLQDDIWIKVGGNAWHNSFNYIDPAVYANEHADWFSADKTQLCYTNDEMREELTRKLIEHVEANPNLNNITITQEDVNTWCNRPKEVELRNKYGTDAASMIIFANKVSRSLKEHFKQKGSDRVVDISFFAYHRTETAPVKYDSETDTYSPIDEEVICDENVNVFYAPIFADYNVNVKDPQNRNLYETMRAWTTITDKFYLWIYSTNFNQYLSFFNSFDSMQSLYKFARLSNTYYIYDQGQWNQTGATGFSALKNYLNPMLQWNVNLNMEELTKDWFDNYFKVASKPMKELFDNIRTHYVYLRSETSMSNSIFAEMTRSEYFSKGLLDGWMEKIDEAHKVIESLKDSNRGLYEKLYRRIEQEFVFIGYMLVELHQSAYSPSDLLKLKNRVRDACVISNITMVKETNSIYDLWEKWGI